jgi:hypothetical protein
VTVRAGRVAGEVTGTGWMGGGVGRATEGRDGRRKREGGRGRQGGREGRQGSRERESQGEGGRQGRRDSGQGRTGTRWRGGESTSSMG